MSNNDSTEVAAASVEEATRIALEQLGAREDEVTIEVLATARAGVLGLGARQARVRVTRRGTGAAGAGAPEASGPASYQQAVQAQHGAQAGAPPRSEAPPRAGRDNNRRGRNDRRGRGGGAGAPGGERHAAENDDDAGASGAPRKDADLAQQRLEAIEVLKQILEQMGEKTQVREVQVDEETVELEIQGDGSGILIGRHGQTLDALEYLVNRILARRIKDAAPVSLETESYRARRRQQLHRMALSMGEKAKREHKPVRLEPMPPRDRRVVHLALKDDPMITTRSAGEGQMRSIEIVPTEAGRREPRGEGGQGQQHRGRRRHNERARDVQPIEPRANDAIGEQGGFKHGQKRIV